MLFPINHDLRRPLTVEHDVLAAISGARTSSIRRKERQVVEKWGGLYLPPRNVVFTDMLTALGYAVSSTEWGRSTARARGSTFEPTVKSGGAESAGTAGVCGAVGTARARLDAGEPGRWEGSPTRSHDNAHGPIRDHDAPQGMAPGGGRLRLRGQVGDKGPL